MRLLLATVALLLLPAASVGATEEVTVSDLLERGAELSGTQVALTGELVGDYGFRNDGWMWTQLNDDGYVYEPTREGSSGVGGNVGVGIRMPTSLGESLDDPGGYRVRGPVVRVTGVWKYHDPERQGESFVQVDSLEVIEPGRALEEGPQWWTSLIGLTLVIAAMGVWVTRPRPR